MKWWQKFLVWFITAVIIVLIMSAGIAILSACIKGLLWFLFLLFHL